MKTIKITVPGSKSLTNRAIIMASLSNGTSKISNISNSLDSQTMIKAMKKLGIKIKTNKNELLIIGNGGIFPKFNGSINVGSAGTVTRFLTALKILVQGQIIIVKSKKMKERPMKELINALKTVITGKVLISGGVSSQFITALMMIAPMFDKGLEININGRMISSSYVDMTIELMKKFGVKVEKITSNKFVVKKQRYISTNYVVESDLSGASYFFAAAAVTGKSIKVKNINLDSVQGDRFFPDLLKKMGCEVKKNIEENWIEVKGPKILKGITVDMINMPDTAQTLAVLAAFAKGKTIITGLSTLKIKETDRLVALKNELNKIKIKSEITNDSITVIGGNPKKAVIETYGDHRMAMAFVVAKLKVPELIIRNPEVVNKSFPEFWDMFDKLGSMFFDRHTPMGAPGDSLKTPEPRFKFTKLVLIGFMGSGKTTVANVLAKKLNLEVIEMDNLIVKQERKSISEIFNEDGEARFRQLESQIAKDLREKKNVVISTGGGVVINKTNMNNLKINGKIIFLKTSFLEINRRLKNIKDRPLFKNKKLAEKLFKFRQKLYEKNADLIVNTDGKSVEKITYEIIS